ncbi:hypothetical protein CLG96_05960 [Sphingomonas oleivorans]|uniref:Uncharacterized protein n=1 Tax=Sphingomonas oleivorans TaxID=1735121 RepID=A0A2T5FZH9_9SPHN|nr:hypothetical protein [Sphingomonas oleivorans]PTQ12108.1 hypothetical protein CLG96_05960 [Sphingomonas oleivorans]
MPPLDPFTADTVRAMVRYVADDARIARHCRCDIRTVRAIRRSHKAPHFHKAGLPLPRERRENLDAARDIWPADARRGTDGLLRAMRRAGVSAA